MNYYHSLQEKTKEIDKGAFGIYGNLMWSYRNFHIGIYRNKRSTSLNFLTLKKNDLIYVFRMPENTSVSDFKRSLLKSNCSTFKKFRLSNGRNPQRGL